MATADAQLPKHTSVSSTSIAANSGGGSLVTAATAWVWRWLAWTSSYLLTAAFSMAGVGFVLAPVLRTRLRRALAKGAKLSDIDGVSVGAIGLLSIGITLAWGSPRWVVLNVQNVLLEFILDENARRPSREFLRNNFESPEGNRKWSVMLQSVVEVQLEDFKFLISERQKDTPLFAVRLKALSDKPSGGSHKSVPGAGNIHARRASSAKRRLPGRVGYEFGFELLLQKLEVDTASPSGKLLPTLRIDCPGRVRVSHSAAIIHGRLEDPVVEVDLNGVSVKACASSAIHPAASARPTQLLSAKELSLHGRVSLPMISEFFGEVLVKTPDMAKGHATLHVSLVSVRACVDEDTLCVAAFLMACSRRLYPRERNEFRDAVAREALVKRVTALARSALEMFYFVGRVHVVDPAVVARVRSYVRHAPSTDSDAIIFVRLDELMADVFSKEGAEMRSVSNLDLNASFDSSLHLKAELRSLSIIACAVESGLDDLQLPVAGFEGADRIACLNYVVIRSHVVLPGEVDFDGSSVDFQCKVDLGLIVIDLSSAEGGRALDYFALAKAAANTLVVMLPLITRIQLPEDIPIYAASSATSGTAPSFSDGPTMSLRFRISGSVSQIKVLMSELTAPGVMVVMNNTACFLETSDSFAAGLERNNALHQAVLSLGSLTITTANDLSSALDDSEYGDSILLFRELRAESDPGEGFGRQWKARGSGIQMRLDFRCIYICLMTFVRFAKFARLFHQEGALGRRRVSARKSNLHVLFELDKLEGWVSLPNEVLLYLVVNDLSAVLAAASVACHVNSFSLSVQSEIQPDDELLVGEDLSIDVSKDDAGAPVIKAVLSDATATNPDGFELACVFDELINISKAIKNIIFESLELTPAALRSPGHTHVDAVRLPTIEAQIDNSWTTEGILIVAESFATEESLRIVRIPLTPLDIDPVVVMRNINPVKVYTRSNTVVKSSGTVFCCWGACLEAPLADMARIFETFTRPTVDPSAPLGWWDKLRIIMHGSNVVRFEGAGRISLRVLGATTPYFDARAAAGGDDVEGVDLTIGSGAELRFGCSDSPAAGEDVVVTCGELVVSIPRSPNEGARVLAGRKVALREDIIGRFVGGVRVAVGFEFKTLGAPDGTGVRLERSLTKDHSDIVLRTPEHVPDVKDFDSYIGFRTSSIHITVNVQSPRHDFSSPTQPNNYISFTNKSIRSILAFIPIYQSPLISIPIHQGRIFNPKGPLTIRPKLGRTIRSTHITGTLHPLVASMMSEAEDACAGVRCRAERLDVDVLLEQRPLHVSHDIIRAKTTEWTLQASSAVFTQLEGRIVLPFGSPASGAVADTDVDEEFAELKRDDERREWSLPEDTVYADGDLVRTIPFAWTPKFIYFKRNQDAKKADMDKRTAENDVFDVQLQIYRERLREIEASIGYFLNIQSHLEYRIQVFYDDSLKPESLALVDMLGVLHEKKQVIQGEIKRCEDALRSEAEHFSAMQQDLENHSAGPLFDHRYIIHNINILWEKEVRNAVFKFWDIIRRDGAIKYCLSNSAMKTVKELVHMVAQRAAGRRSGKSAAKKDEKGAAYFDAQMAEELLARLLGDLENLVVPNETYYQSSTVDLTYDEEEAAHGGNLANAVAYIPSSDPNSPDFVQSGHSVDSDFIIQFINPQINFESAPQGNPAALHTVILAAESMQYRSIAILDSSAEATEDPLDRSAGEVKSRTIVNVSNAQFFTARKSDILIDNSSTDYIVTFGPDLAAGSDGADSVEEPERPAAAGGRQHWPLWVPLECIISLSSPTGFLGRIVEQTSAWIYRDRPNPLYARLRGEAVPQREDPLENVDFFLVNFPHFNVTVDSVQFHAIFDVVANLLVYRDVQSAERKKKLKKTMLFVNQMDDLKEATRFVADLQDKIRQASGLVRFSRFPEEKEAELRQCLQQYEDEIIIVMEALNNESKLERKRNSVEVGWKLQVSAKTLKWIMTSGDSGGGGGGGGGGGAGAKGWGPTAAAAPAANAPVRSLAEWTLSEVKYMLIFSEDQATTNILEIDELHLENLSNAVNSFRTIMAPYVPDGRMVNFKRNKMLRVYWREMPPVGGIPVVDHFEVNVFPLLLQITREMVSQLETYFFPNRKQKRTKELLQADDTAATVATSGRTAAASDAVSEKTTDTGEAAAAGAAAMVTTRPSRPASAHVVPSMRSFGDDSGTMTGTAASEVGDQLPQQQQRRRRLAHRVEKRRSAEPVSELQQMQMRAAENRSFIYIKIPGVRHCISYK
ncbi:hypothetical protein HK405_007709, partial [Cladochytrium tenue]